VYTRFHGSNTLASTGYEDLLALCPNAYCTARETLLGLTVLYHMDTLRERHGLVVGKSFLDLVVYCRDSVIYILISLVIHFPDKQRHPRTTMKGAVVDDNKGGKEVVRMRRMTKGT
jgi:hypothetical protein